jgi:hypothetical protein
MRRHSIDVLVIVGALVLLPSATVFAQCTASCGTGVCPLTPYTGPTACFPPATAPSCPVGTVTFANQTTFTWPGAACATAGYDVAMGDLACLRGNCALALTCPGCMPGENNDMVDTMAIDAGVLLPGEGVWYLVRVDGDSWNTTGAGQCSDYDTTLFPPSICTP